MKPKETRKGRLIAYFVEAAIGLWPEFREEILRLKDLPVGEVKTAAAESADRLGLPSSWVPILYRIGTGQGLQTTFAREPTTVLSVRAEVPDGQWIELKEGIPLSTSKRDFRTAWTQLGDEVWDMLPHTKRRRRLPDEENERERARWVVRNLRGETAVHIAVGKGYSELTVQEAIRELRRELDLGT